MESWEEVPSEQANGQQVLGCMRVYTYKCDQAGLLKKCKARLVVQGDQQQVSTEDTYAATLAARSFRTLMAITARCDLELIQYDAVNAFANASLEKEVMTHTPPG